MTLLPLVVALAIFLAYVLILAWQYRDRQSVLDLAVGAFVLTTTQIVATQTLLGWMGLIGTWPVLIVNLIPILSVLVLTSRLRIVAVGVLTDARSDLTNLVETMRSYPVVAIALLWTIVLIGYHSAIAWILPPLEWDSLRYHLPIAAQIIQNGGLSEVPTDTIWINTYPKNFDLIFLWWMLLAQGDQGVNAAQIPFLIAGVAAIYSICRTADLSRHHSILGSVLFAGAPVVLQQVTGALVDVMTSVSAILAAWAFYRYACRGHQLDLFLCGLAAGLLAGGKGNAIVWPVILTFMILIIAWRKAHSASFRNTLTAGLAFCVPALLLSFPWYAKNWWHYGNPVQPYQVEILGHTIFPGDREAFNYLAKDRLDSIPAQILETFPGQIAPANGLEMNWYAWHEPVLSFSSVGAWGGLGSVWFILLLPALPLAAFLAWSEKRRSILLLYLIMLPPYLAFLQYQWITRYGIYILALGIVAFVLVLDTFPRMAKGLRLFALLLFFASSVHGSLNRNATPGQLRTLLALPYQERMVATGNAFNTTNGTRELMQWWRKQAIAGTRLYYHCNPWVYTYPLWDSHFSNRVDYVPEQQDSAEWARSLIDADWVLVSANTREDAWTRDLDAFTREFNDDVFTVYKKK